MHYCFLVAGVFVVAMQISSLSVAQDGGKEMIGVWTCASATIDGNPLAEETARQLKLTLTADRYKSQRGEQVLFDSSYKVDASRTPKQIEMIGTEGDLKGKAVRVLIEGPVQLHTLRLHHTRADVDTACT